MPVGPLDVVTLEEAKPFLNIAAGVEDDDDEIQAFITAMTGVIEGEVGPVVQREETADIDGSGGANCVLAPSWPMVSVTSGAYLLDNSTVDVSSMVPRKGVITTIDATAMPLQPWILTYQAGRPTIPADIKAGALEVLKLAWATQRGKDAPAFLISYRAAAWFKGQSFSIGFA